MFQEDLGVRSALSAPPFAAFCELKTVEPPRRGCLAAMCGGGDMSQRPAAPSFEQHHRSRRPQMPITVEPYGRSAAGVVVEPNHLRTPLALEKSMHFLVHHYLRDPHTPAVFLAPFDVWRYLWDRMRQVRTNWVPQLPPVGTESLSSHDYADGVLPPSVRESKRRLKWLEFTVAALAVGGANLCRTVHGCRQYMGEKQNFLESIAQCFSDLVLSYRAEQRLRNSEMFSAILLFYGLSQLTKVENRAGFCRVMQVQTTGDAAPTHVFELPSSSVDFASVYRELAYLPHMARTRHVRTVLKLIHSWCQREWFRFFYLCRTEPLTVLQRAMVFHSFSYARFRAIVDLVTANEVVYSKARLRGEMSIADLADLLLMEEEHCVEMLETMGLAAQLSDDRTMLRVAQPDSLPYTTQEQIYRHLEETGGKPRLCFPTMPSFFGFAVWRRAFELFPDAFGDDPEGTHGNLNIMTCPVNLMQLLEPYCPPYNDDVAALELTDIENTWFTDVQEAREKMLLWHASHVSFLHDACGADNNLVDDDNNGDNNNNAYDDDVWGALPAARTGEKLQEQRSVIVEAMDRESQSTHTSVFDDDVDGGGSGESRSERAGEEEEEGQEVRRQQHLTESGGDENARGEDEEVVCAAKALLKSLQDDAVYAKIREELKQREKEAEEKKKKEVAPVTPENAQTNATAASHDCADRDENYGAKTQDTVRLEQQQQQQQQSAGSWLRLQAPKFPVGVTPLPSDHPEQMSPTLRAVVETPQSIVADTDAVPLMTDEEKSSLGSLTEVQSASLSSFPTSTAKATMSFPSFPPASAPFSSASVDVPWMQKTQAGDVEKFRAKRRREEPNEPTVMESPPPPPTAAASTVSNSQLQSKEKKFRQQEQLQVPGLQEQQPCGLEGSRRSSLAGHAVLLPFEKEEEERQKQRLETNTSVKSFPQQTRVENMQQESSQDLHSMRKVRFAVSSSSVSQEPVPSSTKKVVGEQVARSYQETIRMYLRRQRDAPRGSVGHALLSRDSALLSGKHKQQEQRQQQQEQQLLRSSSCPAAGIRTRGEDVPLWMRAFINYLIHFFVASYDDKVACRFLSEIVCCNSDVRARNVAGWLCRGFTPTIVPCVPPYPFGVKEEKMPMLRLASKIVVFGTGMRNDGTHGAGCHSPRRSTVHALPPKMRASSTPTLGRWVTSLLLTQDEGAAFRASDGAIHNAWGQEDEDGEDNTVNGRDVVGFWEQLHKVRMAGSSHIIPAAAAFEQPRQHAAMLQTQLALHGVDFCDVPHLRWAAVEADTSTQRPVEHITAIVTLDATRPSDYEEGIATLRLLVQHAAEQRVIFLAGVIVVLYTRNLEEDVRLRGNVEEEFWARWRQSADATTQTTLSTDDEEEKVVLGRIAYQRTVRHALSKVKQTERSTPLSARDSTVKPHPHSGSNGTNKMLNAIRSLFRRSDGEHDVSRVSRRTGGAFGSDMTPPNAPSPVLVVLPVRTAVAGGAKMSGGNTKNDRRSTGDCCTDGGNFAAINAGALRMALLQAVGSLLRGYEVKWKTFLRENDAGAKEDVLDVI